MFSGVLGEDKQVNIFVLDNCPVQSAVYQCDKHVVKMILETTQMLSTIVGGPYKPTHVNHPCTIWARESVENFLWLKTHGLALCKEYTHRYGKKHKCEDILWNMSVPDTLSGDTLTPFALAMPEEFKSSDPVKSYRDYYHTKKEFCRWTNRSTPPWWNPRE